MSGFLRCHRFFIVVQFVTAFALCRTMSLAQPSNIALSALEIQDITFTGNTSFDTDILKSLIRTKESPGGIPKLLHNIFGKLGAGPEYFEPSVFDDDAERLKRFYQDNGFFNATVDGSTTIDSSARQIHLLFTIREGQRAIIDSIRYVGLDSVSQDVRQSIYKEPLLQKNMPFQPVRGSAEIARVLEILNNAGYPLARYDEKHSIARKYLSTNKCSLIYAFTPGKRYYFGSTTVHVDPPREDITPDLATRQLDFQTGDIYSRDKGLSSERNLNRLGIFETARLEPRIPPDSSTSTEVPIDITVRPRLRNELSPELLVSDEGGFFNLGTGLGYTNRNFLGDARTFTAQSQVRTEDIFDWNFHNVFGSKGLRDSSVKGAIDFQFRIFQPYLFTRSLSGSWTSSYTTEKQQDYNLSILRNKIELTKQFATYTFGFLEWTLERMNPEFLLPTGTQDSVFVQIQAEYPPQFNSILTFTLQRDKTNDIFSPSDGFFESISLEESGILPKILPGIRSGLPFTQYYKGTLLGKLFFDLTNTRFNILALKLKTGYQDKYGESRYSNVSIPLTQRFFAGGSNSVRGWGARELGAMSPALVPFGGNFLFEGSMEMRVNHFRGFNTTGFIKPQNIWMVYFVDFGNAWGDIKDFKPREVAIAAGAGFRYETFFGPFRVDYGFRLFDPTANGSRQSVFQKPFWSETIGNGVFHFGIGQAF